MFIRRPVSPVGLLLGCALVLLVNIQCGEYLLLHYLTSSDGPLSPGKAVVEQADGASEGPACTQPAAATASELPTTPVEVQPVNPQNNPTPSTSPGTCLDGDLNKDGKVDGLDIQVLVNCLLQQQPN